MDNSTQSSVPEAVPCDSQVPKDPRLRKRTLSNPSNSGQPAVEVAPPSTIAQIAPPCVTPDYNNWYSNWPPPGIQVDNTGFSNCFSQPPPCQPPPCQPYYNSYLPYGQLNVPIQPNYYYPPPPVIPPSAVGTSYPIQQFDVPNVSSTPLTQSQPTQHALQLPNAPEPQSRRTRKSRFSDVEPHPPRLPQPREKRRSRSRDRLSRSTRSSRDSSYSPPRRKRFRSRSPKRRSRSSDRRRSPSRERRRSRSRDRQRRRTRTPPRRYSSRSLERSRVSPVKELGAENNERDRLIEKWRRLNCKDDEELEKRLLEISSMDSEQLLAAESSYWIRSAPATTFYDRDAR